MTNVLSKDNSISMRSAHTQPSNFIVFGEMGVGKSSLVNLIAGEQIASSSSGAQSCTLASTEYQIRLSDPQLHFNLFDTVGLNNPTMTNAGYLDALVKAHELIVSLRNRGGVHGLIFCIRGGSVSNTMHQNYRLFYEFLCQAQVPLALVITNLENEENMDEWWTHNKAHVEKSGIVPVTHACITTIKGYNNAYANKYFESRKTMHEMLKELRSKEAFSADVDIWFARMCRKLPEFLIPNVKSDFGRSRQKMLQVLTKRCKMDKEDALRFLQRIYSDEERQ